jgi:hypothetical protein
MNQGGGAPARFQRARHISRVPRMISIVLVTFVMGLVLAGVL